MFVWRYSAVFCFPEQRIQKNKKSDGNVLRSELWIHQFVDPWKHLTFHSSFSTLLDPSHRWAWVGEGVSFLELGAYWSRIMHVAVHWKGQITHMFPESWRHTVISYSSSHTFFIGITSSGNHCFQTMGVPHTPKNAREGFTKFRHVGVVRAEDISL